MPRIKPKWAILIAIPFAVAVGMANVSSWRPRRVRVPGQPFQVAFSPDGQRVALATQSSGAVSGRVAVWDFGHPSWLHQPSLGNQQTFLDHYPSSICFSNDSQVLVCVDYDDKRTIHRWNVATGQAATPLRTKDGDTGRFAHTSPDTGGVAFWTGKSVEQRDAQSGQVKKHVRLYNDEVWKDSPYDILAFSPDGKTTAWPINENRGALIMRDASGHKSRLAPLIPHSDDLQCTITALTYSPDSRFLVIGWTADIYSSTGGADSTSSRVSIWDLQTRKIASKWTESQATINAHAFSPDGTLLAAARADGTVSLREAKSGHLIRNFKIAGDDAPSVAFSPDGRTLASCGSDGALYLWRVK